MLAVSIAPVPAFLLCFSLSDPARSTKDTFPWRDPTGAPPASSCGAGRRGAGRLSGGAMISAAGVAPRMWFRLPSARL